MTTAVIKKKRFRPNKKRYRVSMFPRVFKRDLRRLYPRMLANILNSDDSSLLRSFFATFSVPFCNVSGETATMVKDQPLLKPPTSDVDDLVLNFSIEQELMPDLAVTMKGASIKQYLNRNGHSQVICGIQFVGMKVYEYERTATTNQAALAVDEYLNQLRPISSFIMEDMGNSSIHYVPTVSSISASKKTLLEKPFQILFNGRITLDLNEDKQITGVSFESCE